MNNAAKTEAAREKAAEPRKPQNPEALRAQEQKVTHDKVVNICTCTTISKALPLRIPTCPNLLREKQRNSNRDEMPINFHVPRSFLRDF